MCGSPSNAPEFEWLDYTEASSRTHVYVAPKITNVRPCACAGKGRRWACPLRLRNLQASSVSGCIYLHAAWRDGCVVCFVLCVCLFVLQCTYALPFARWVGHRPWPHTHTAGRRRTIFMSCFYDAAALDLRGCGCLVYAEVGHRAIEPLLPSLVPHRQTHPRPLTARPREPSPSRNP